MHIFIIYIVSQDLAGVLEGDRCDAEKKAPSEREREKGRESKHVVSCVLQVKAQAELKSESTRF